MPESKNLAVIKTLSFDERVTRFAASKDQKEYAVNINPGGYQGSLRRLDAKTHKEIGRYEFKGSSLEMMKYLDDGNLWIQLEGHIFIWRSGELEPEQAFKANHFYWAVTDDGRWAASHDEHRLDVYEVASGKTVSSFPLKEFLGDMFFHSSGKSVYAFGKDGMHRFDVADKQRQVVALPVMPNRFTLSPDGEVLFLVDKDGIAAVQLVDGATPWKTCILDEMWGDAMYSASLKQLVIHGHHTSEDLEMSELLRVVDPANGDELAAFQPFGPRGFCSYGFLPDQKTLVLAEEKGCVLLLVDWPKTMAMHENSPTPFLELLRNQRRLYEENATEEKDGVTLADFYELRAGDFPSACKLSETSGSLRVENGKATGTQGAKVRWGRRLYDILCLDLSEMIVSKRTQELFEKMGFSGWLPGKLRATWKAGIQPESSYAALLANSITGTYPGAPFIIKDWNGEDFAGQGRSSRIVVRRRVVDALLEAGITGWEATNVLEPSDVIRAPMPSMKKAKSPSPSKIKPAKPKITGKRPALTKVRKLLKEAGLAEQIDDIEAALLPAAEVSLGAPPKGALAVGATRIGGEPDLPAGVDWPKAGGRRLGFLGQFNLADLAKIDEEKLLPNKGLLSFFLAPPDEKFGGDWMPEGKHGCRILYSASTSKLQRFSAPDDLPKDAVIEPVAPAFRLNWSWPHNDHPVGKELGLGDDDDFYDFTEMYEELVDMGEPHNRWLGYPMSLQNSVVKQAAREATKVKVGRKNDTWRLLLQLDSDGEMGISWGPDGILYVLCPEADVKKRDFSRAWALVQFT